MILSQFETATGLIQLKILSTHESGAYTSQIGNLNYSFDQTPDTLSIDRVQALYTYVNVDLLQYDDIGSDLWSILTSETNTVELKVEFTIFTPDGGFEFLFRLRKSDISLNEKSQIVTLRLTPAIKPDETMAELFDYIYTTGTTVRTLVTDSQTDDVDTQSVDTYSYNCISPKDFISLSLNRIFENEYGNIISSTELNIGDSYSSEIYPDFEMNKNQFVVTDIRTTPVTLATGGLSNVVALIKSDDPPSTSMNIEIGAFQTRIDESVTISVNFPDVVPSVGDDIYFASTSPTLAEVYIGTVLDFGFDSYDARLIRLPDVSDLSPRPSMGVYPAQIAPVRRVEDTPAINILKDMAGIEGSVFGTGFSKNWFFNRIQEVESNSDILKTINWNEVIESKPFSLTVSLGESVVSQISDKSRLGADNFGQWEKITTVAVNDSNPQKGSGVPNLFSFNSITNGNKSATKGIDIAVAVGYPFVNKGRLETFFSITSVNGRQFGVLSNPQAAGVVLESALTRNGLKSYFQSLNASEDSIAIEFEVIGALRVFPYEIIQFDVRAPERYRDRQFRITQINYDFINDKVKIKAYQVSSITTPTRDDDNKRLPPPGTPPPEPPPPPPPPPTGSFIGFTNASYTGEENGGLGITEIELRLNAPLENGKEYWIINRRQLSSRDIYTGIYAIIPDLETAFSQTGVVTIPIETQVVIAPTGSLVILAPAQVDVNQIIFEVGQEFLQGQVAINSQAISTLSSVINVEVENVISIAEQITALNTRVDGFESNINVNSLLIAQLTSQVTIVQGDIVTQGQSITAIQSNIDNIEIDIDGVEANVSAQATAIDILQTNVSFIEGNITTQADRITTLNVSVFGTDDRFNTSDEVWNTTDITWIQGLPALAKAEELLTARVTVTEGSIVSQSQSITALQSDVQNIDGTINAQATAISALETNVSSIDGILTTTAERVDVIEANVTTLDGQFTAVSSDVSNVSIEVDEVTGKVTNISAKRAIVVGAGGKLAEIDLSVTGNGSAVTSFINISADQVAIQDIIFDAEGAVYSKDFLTTGAPTTNGKIVDGVIDREGEAGWVLDRTGKAVFNEAVVRKGSSIDGLNLTGNVGAIGIFNLISDLPTGTYPGSSRTVVEGDVAYVKDTPNSLWRYDGTEWIRTLNGDDLLANSVTAGKIDVANLNAINANTGNLSVTGILKIFSGGEIDGGNFKFTNTGGTISGWIIDENVLKSQASNRRIELNKEKNRVSIFGTDTEDAVMGYLAGLPRNQDTSTFWASNNYGFWARKGTDLVIDGDIEYDSGDWLIQSDAAIRMLDQTSPIKNEVLRVGNSGGALGLYMFAKDGVDPGDRQDTGSGTEVLTGTVISAFTSEGFLIGDKSGGNYVEYIQSTGVLDLRGTLNADDMNVGTLNVAVLEIESIFATNVDVRGELKIFDTGFIHSPGIYKLDPSGFTIDSDAQFDITMGANGKITNSGSDFLIDADGVAIRRNVGVNSIPERTFGILNSSNVVTSGIWANSVGSTYYSSINGDIRMQLWSGGTFESPSGFRGQVAIRSTGSVDIETAISGHLTLSTQFGTGELRLKVNSNEGMNISGLPTSNPGGSGNVWRDSVGILRIT